MPSSKAQDDFSASWWRQSYGRLLLDLEGDTLDDEGYLRLCRDTGLLSELIDRLLSLGRVDEAAEAAKSAPAGPFLRIVDQFEQYGFADTAEQIVQHRWSASQDWQLGEWLTRRCQARGDLAGAYRYSEALFHASPSLERYRELRGLGTTLKRWTTARPELLRVVQRSAGYPWLLGQIYLDEGEIDSALDLALQTQQPRQPSVHGGWPMHVGHDWRLDVARAAEATRPRSAVNIYRDVVERLIDARGRENYQQACQHLLRMRDLQRKLGEDDVWERYLSDLRDRTRSLRALKEELAAAGL